MCIRDSAYTLACGHAIPMPIPDPHAHGPLDGRQRHAQRLGTRRRLTACMMYVGDDGSAHEPRPAALESNECTPDEHLPESVGVDLWTVTTVRV